MSEYRLEEDDHIWIVVRCGDGETIGRAVSQQDGQQFADELNNVGKESLRERVLAEVNDAIENCFEGLS